MNIEHKRIFNCPTYCISRMYIDGEWVCDMVEDTDRGLDQDMSLNEIKQKKVKHLTAIPTGTYELTLDIQSPKFVQYDFYKKLCNGFLPRLLNVKGFDGILIHCGASAASSSGCIIVGENKIKGRVVNSKKTFTKLLKTYLLPAKRRGEKITYTITR